MLNRVTLTLAALAALMAPSAAALAQTVIEPGLSVQRVVTGIPINSPFGMDVDPATRNLYFLADAGRAIYVLEPGGALRPIVSNVGAYGDREADLRLGPDNLLYAMGAAQGGVASIDRFRLDGSRVAPEHFLLAGALSAYGIDFDCRGQLYVSDNTPEITRIGLDGFISIFSEGWSDVDEIEQAPDDALFVHQGSDRNRVYRVGPDGTFALFLQGLNNVTTGAFDWGNRNYIVADTTDGVLFRLRDLNADQVIQQNEISTIASNLGRIGDVAWGLSSQNLNTASIYVGNPELGRIIEITGLVQPPNGVINCGNLIDDDGDGWCEFGFDANRDRDCEDPFEEQPQGDCDDSRRNVNPDATEICDDNDNDCNPGTPDGISDPLSNRPCDGTDRDLCLEGVFSCAPGRGMICTDATGDNVELCNRQDDDCDPGTPDGSGAPGFGEACDGNDSDLCPEGVRACNGQAIFCNDNTSDTLDVCDGQDNDCNPLTFDGQTDPRRDEPCDGPDEDLCPEGTFDCVNGVPRCDDATGDNVEICDGQDDDCDPNTPDGVDEDTFGQACDGPDGDLCPEGEIVCVGGALFCDDPTGTTLDVCDGVDNDCDPDTPNGSGDPLFGTDCDSNDEDACADGAIVCNGFNLVCDDDELSLLEVCNDGIDNDCDENADDLDFDCRGSLDRDGDGFCTDGEDFNRDGDCTDEGEDQGRPDCNDVSSSINPDAIEVCLDSQDNDCDDLLDLEDPDCDRSIDRDGDGFCGEGEDRNGDGDCLDTGEQTGDVDCDDENEDISPGVEEVCGDEIDNDCDADVDALDADCPDFADRDGDTFCPSGRDLNDDGDCLDEEEQTEDSDCDDDSDQINPEAAEVCGDGLDNDCGGTGDLDDAGCAALVDNDGDGFCEAGEDRDDDGDCFDERERREPFDCDDDQEAVSPSAEEICGDGVDNDCEGGADGADAGCADLVDGDADGVCPAGDDANGDGDCFDEGEADAGQDCNDAAPTVFVGAEEICGDEADNDCDGDTDAEDEDCLEFADRDNDDFCPTGRDLNDDSDCVDEGEDNGDSDCNDDDIFIHKEARERCDDAIDNDCDGDTDLDDEDCAEPPLDTDGDGVPDDEDVCPGAADPDQADSDGNGVGDACEPEEECACASVQTPAAPAPWGLILGFVALAGLRRRRGRGREAAAPARPRSAGA